MSLFIATAYAQEAAPTPVAGPSLLETMVPFLFIFVVMYFLVLRPQAKKAKDHANLLSNLKKGDEVVTTGGVIGKVASVADTFINLEIAHNTTIKVLKGNVAALTHPPEKAAVGKPAANKKGPAPTT